MIFFENIFKVLWLIQKFVVRIIHRRLLSSRILSVRKSQIPYAVIVNTTNDELTQNSYKLNMDSNYRKIISLSNVKLNPKTGIVWYKDKIVSESSVWDIRDLIKWEPLPFFYVRKKGTFNSLPDNGYFHFLIEDLPRFIEVNMLNKSSQTIGGSNAKYIIETLDFLCSENYFVPAYPLKLNTLYLSEKVSGKLFSRTDLDLLKICFANHINKIASKKVFISRKDQKGSKFESRGLSKKNEIENSFASFGFQIVFMEDLSFFEQIKLSSSSISIAGFHGAGLSNMVWANPGTKIIEITNTRNTEHFRYISKICDQEYFRYSIEEPLNNLTSVLNHV